MGKVLCFFAPDHKSGCSMLSQCLAEFLAKRHPGGKFLLLHCHARPGTMFSPGVRESMDRIKPYLVSGSADISEISELAHWKDNIYVISGMSALGGTEDFMPDMTVYLVERLKPSFDLIICDAGSDPDQGIALGALLSAERIFTVLSQRESSLRRFEWLKGLYERLGMSGSPVVLNMYQSSDPYSGQYVSRRLGIAPQDLYCVRRSEYGGLAEIEERSLLGYKDARFNKDMAALAAFAEELLSRPAEKEDEGGQLQI